MGLALPLVVLALVFVVARLVTGRRAAGHPAYRPSPELQATARTTRRWRLAGTVVGVGVALLAAHQGALGRGLLLTAPVFALCVLGGVLIGELRLGAPSGEVRSAALEVRRLRDYVPWRLGATVASATVALAVILTWTTAVGSPDDMGRAGRSLARRCSPGSGESHGPWPGAFYALPLALLVVCGVVAAGVALTRIVRRPRRTGDLAVDDALRRSAAEAVTAAAGLLVAVPLAGVCGVAAAGLLAFGCAPASWTVGGYLLLALLPVAAALAAWCAAVLAWPVDGVRAEPLVADR